MPYVKSKVDGIAGAALAIAAAGPIFATTTMLASLYAEIPQPVVITAPAVSMFGMLLIPITVFGALLALLPVTLGAFSMRALAERFEWARGRIAWVLMGGAGGSAIAILFGGAEVSPPAFGLALTGAVCGGLCHHTIRLS